MKLMRICAFVCSAVLLLSGCAAQDDDRDSPKVASKSTTKSTTNASSDDSIAYNASGESIVKVIKGLFSADSVESID